MKQKHEIDYIKENYGTIKAIQIAKTLNFTLDEVYYYAKKFKLKGDQGINRKYTCNHNFFAEVNCKTSFWAGFIAADGCATGGYLKIMLSLLDKEMLEKFHKDCEYDGPMYVDYIRKRVSLEISSKKILKDLESKWNIVPRKSLILSPPTIELNDSCFLSFVCGYINGDGCVYLERGTYPRLSIVGTYNMLSWMMNKIKLKSYLGRVGNVYQLKYSGKNAKHLSVLIHALDTPYYLSRKWNKLS